MLLTAQPGGRRRGPPRRARRLSCGAGAQYRRGVDECGEPTELVDRATLESLGVSPSKVEMFLAGREAAPVPVSILRRLEILALPESVEEINREQLPRED